MPAGGGVDGPRAAALTITIDASTPAGKVSPLLYGRMSAREPFAYLAEISMTATV